MPANVQPIFPLTPKTSSVVLAAARAFSDGSGTIGTNLFRAFVSGQNGSRVYKVRFALTGIVAATANAASAARVYLSTKTGATDVCTAADTWLIGSTSWPIIAGGVDQATVADVMFDVPINEDIETGRVILVSMHVAAPANTGVMATVFGGDY